MVLHPPGCGRVGRRRTTIHERPTPHGVGLSWFHHHTRISSRASLDAATRGRPVQSHGARRPDGRRPPASPGHGYSRWSSAHECGAGRAGSPCVSRGLVQRRRRERRPPARWPRTVRPEHARPGPGHPSRPSRRRSAPAPRNSGARGVRVGRRGVVLQQPHEPHTQGGSPPEDQGANPGSGGDDHRRSPSRRDRSCKRS